MADAPSPGFSVESPADYSVESPEQLNFVLQVAGPIAYALCAFLAFGFFAEITRLRFWHSRNFVIGLLLTLAKSPLVHWIGQFQAFMISAPHYNELYFVWGALLLTGFSSLLSIAEYKIYINSRTKLMELNEKVQLINSFSVLVFLSYYTYWYTPQIYWPIRKLTRGSVNAYDYDPGNFISVLWIIWVFSLIKSLFQIISYYYVDSSYGSADTKLISFYMTKQKEVSNFDPKTMTGYKYLIVYEKPLIFGKAPTYELTVNDGMKNLITLEDVWLSKGQLLTGRPGEKLKDVCLSFALFKMLKRRFEEQCETAEANRAETRDFICRGLLESKPDRVIKVIDMELRFLRDLFYTKYHTVLGVGFLLYTLFFAALFSSFIRILLKLQNYKPPSFDTHNNRGGGYNDKAVTRFVVLTVMMIVSWESFHYICSNWSKVWLVCKYLNNQRLGSVGLWLSRGIYIPELKKYEIGQYSLLQSYKLYSNYSDKSIGLGYIDMRRKVEYVRLEKIKIMDAILPSLKDFLVEGLHHPTKITALTRHGIEERWELQNAVQTIMTWHVATNFCWMTTKSESKKKKINTELAVNLSNYCAYLVVCEPELLPINAYVCNLVSKQIIKETREFFQNNGKDEFFWTKTRKDEFIVQKMEQVEESEESDKTVICRGVRLGKKLRSVIGEGKNLWDLLQNVWVELMLRLAPSETSIAHATKLVDGGELLTHLWVLLYHAGFPNQASLNGSTASMA